MRIGCINLDPGVPVFGSKGCSIHVRAIVDAFLKRGAEIDLFAGRFDGEPGPAWRNVRLHKPSPLPRGDAAQRERAALGANDELKGALATAGAGSFDLIYERYSLWSHAGMEYARAQGVPGVLEINAPLIEEQGEHRTLMDRASAESVRGRVFDAAAVLLAVSKELAGYLESFSEARGKIHVVPNGVDPDRFPLNAPPRLPRAAGAFTVGFVGSLKPWHGLSTLVEAFALFHRGHPEARLLIVGDGAGQENLLAELTARGLGQAAHLTGMVPAGEVPGWLASMDVAMAPYPKLPRFYFSPLKLYEYMAAGLPVIASRIGQVEAVIENGVNGLLAAPGDAIAFAGALQELWTDAGLRTRLGQTARARVQRDHTWDSVAERILSLAGSACSRQAAPLQVHL